MRSLVHLAVLFTSAVSLAAAQPGGGNTTVVGGAGPVPAGSLCSPGVRDVVTQACLQASTDPMLGLLYPLSVDFNVGMGRVGMGTADPFAALHLQSSSTGIDILDAQFDSVVVEDESAALALYSHSSSYIGSSLSLAESMDNGLRDKWTIGRFNSSGFSRMMVKYGSSLDFEQNASVMSFDPIGNVGIGVEAPQARLHVNELEAGVDAIYAVGDTAVHAVGGETAGVHAESKLGVALFAEHTDATSTTIPAALISTEGKGPAMWVTSSNTVPFAALFGGDVEIGVPGSFGVDPRVILETFGINKWGRIRLKDTVGDDKLYLSGGGIYDSAEILMKDDTGQASVELFASYLGGPSRMKVQQIEITGGADLVEFFDVGSENDVEPGSVLVIDPERAGELRLSAEPYDLRVAGVVSGAGGLNAALHMGQDGVASGDTPVALTGRVYVRCTAENGAIRPGDRLTTSSTSGCAMRATDRERSAGSVLGKAMTAFEGQEGLVLCLVNLQ